jgi:hypothetical protein
LLNYRLFVFFIIHNFLKHFCFFLILQVDASNSTQDDDLLTELQDALSKQRPNCSSSSKLNKAMQIRTQSRIQNRLTQLEGYQFYFNKITTLCCVLCVLYLYLIILCRVLWINSLICSL